jgi:hypothetical protein
VIEVLYYRFVYLRMCVCMYVQVDESINKHKCTHTGAVTEWAVVPFHPTLLG